MCVPRWLKIHLSNLFGVDKVSFDDRVAFTDAHLAEIHDSAENPLTGSQWWMSADYPFLALGVCFDLSRALKSPDPQTYLSHVPIHQDGSCNGLQHYAALARDAKGGKQVNLVPSDKPQDVYTGVADRVIQHMEKDACLDIDITTPVIRPEFPEDVAKELKKTTRKEAFLRAKLEEMLQEEAKDREGRFE